MARKYKLSKKLQARVDAMTEKERDEFYGQYNRMRFTRDLSYFKPKKFKNHLTLAELSEAVGKSDRWLRRLEAQGRIPKPSRVKHGEVAVRLWSPAQVEEIKKILKTHRVGRPRNG